MKKMLKELMALAGFAVLAALPVTTWAASSTLTLKAVAVVGEGASGSVAASKNTTFETYSSSAEISDTYSTTFYIGDHKFTLHVSAQAGAGSVFDGWFENEDCTGSPLSTDTIYTYSESLGANKRSIKTLYAKFRDPSVKIPLSEVTFNLSDSLLNYDGSERSVTISEVSYAGGDLTKDVDYTVDATSVFSAMGSALSNETYKVIINAVDGRDYVGSATNEWKILAPSGSFAADAFRTTTEGCTVNGTTNKVTDSTKLVYTDGKWTMGTKVTVPGGAIIDFVVHPDSLLTFVTANGESFTAGDSTKLTAAGIAISGSKISSGDYKNKTDVQSFTWTQGFTLDEILAARTAGVLRKTLVVYEPAFGTAYSYNNNGGLRVTEFVMEIPIDEKLVLLDQYGNQEYPEIDPPYVAQVNDQKKYQTLSNALEVAQANDKVAAIAATEKDDFTVGKDVALALGAFGHVEATYLLDVADNALGATLVSGKAEEVATKKGFEIVTNLENAVYTYTLQKGHVHAWGNFKAEGNVLTATCVNYEKECTIADRTITLTLTAEDKEYDGKEPTAGFDADERALFEELLSEDPQHMLSIGEVGYTRPDYSVGKWYTGKYTAFATVQIGGVDYTLEKEFSITKPEGGYASGYEVGDVAYDTLAEALAAVPAAGTITCHESFEEQVIDFTAAKNVTIDLNGQLLTYEVEKAAADMTIRNTGDGVVTLVNGTIYQPKGQVKDGLFWKTAYFDTIVEGKFVFGDKLFVDAYPQNALEAGGDPYTLTADDLTIVGGLYQCAFELVDAGRAISITGGDFVENPEAFLADGYALGKEKVAGYPFHVFEHLHEFEFSAEGNAITCHCTDPDCYYDGVSTKLVAEDVMCDGASHGAWLDPAPGEGFPDVKIGITYKLAESGFDINGIPSAIGEYIATATVDASVALGVKATVRYRITDGRPFDLSAIKPLGGEATGRILERSTLTVTNGTALKYFTADKAPDGSGIEGWYVGMTVTWPNETFDIRGFNFTGPKHALFTVNGIKGEDDAKRIFTGEDDIPGISVEKSGFTLLGIDLTRIDSFTWWERITVADVKAADKTGAATIEREVTAWGEKWEEKAGLVTYGDTDGVAPYVFRIIVNLKDLELSDGTYIYWPEHAHDWSYVVNENSITATCSIAECPYSAGVWAEFGPKTVASRLGSPEPLEAKFFGIEKFVGATEATVGEIEYWQGETKLEAAPIEPGQYVAKVVLTLADGETTYDFTTSLEIVAGAIVVDGQHYALEDVPKFVEKMILDGFTKDMYISVGKNFTAERAYTVPAPLLSTDFAGMKTKYFDLNGYTVTAAPGEPFFINSGKLVLCDTSAAQTGRMELYPSNGDGDTPLIINRAGKATKVLGADVIESYGAELTIESGIYLGMISNEVGEVVEVLGQPVDLSAKILIKGGKFLYRPERAWLDKGCYIVEETLDDGTPVFAVYPHVHNYKFVSLGSLVVGYCTTRDEGQGLLEPSSCQAKVVLMTALMQNRPYDGQAAKCEDGSLEVQMLDILLKLIAGKLDEVDVSGAYYINLSAIFRSGFNFNELIDIFEGKTTAETIQEKFNEFGKTIEGWVDRLLNRGQEQAVVVDENEGHLSRLEFEKLTGATVDGPSWTTNASLIDEIFGDEDELLDGAPKDAGAYKVCYDIRTPSANTVSVKNPFEITPLPIEEVKITTDPATNIFIYSGNPTGYKSVKVYSQVDNSYLTAETDYVIGNVTNATEVGDYFFQIIGTRNYEGVTNIYWSVIKPVRPFPSDALEATEEGDEPYGIVNGSTLSVVNAPAIEYSVADQGWWLGYAINWPCVEGDKTLPKDAKLTITYPDWYALDGTMVTRECTGGEILDGEVKLDWGGKFAEKSCRLNVEQDGDGYVKSISWSVLITQEDLYIAHEEGKLAELGFTIKAGCWATDTNPDGLKEMDFSLVVPLGNLELYDVNGYRVFPNHLHTWEFEQDERGWLLSAHCTSDPAKEGECELDGDPWMTLGRYLNEEIEYTGKPVKVRKMNEWEFRFATGAIVGEVEYFETNDLEHALLEAPFQVGTYVARVKVTPMARKDGVGNEPYSLERTFKIVKPLFGYADGFEVKSTERRYDTYREAVAALTGDGDTIYCHEDIEKAVIDLTTPYDVTIDLCDKIVTADAEMTIKNDGVKTGTKKGTTVTLENGTVIQPRHYALKIIQQADQATANGKFVFGRAFRLRNVALLPSKRFTVTIPYGSSLEVTGGSYNAKFDDGSGILGLLGGDISIKGGLFGMNFKPADKQIANGYEVREALGEFAYIVVEKGLSDEDFTKKLADSVVESIDNDAVRGKLADILAKSAITAQEIFNWIKEKIGDLRQNLQEDIQQKIADIIGRLFNSDFLRAAFDLNTGLLDGQEVMIKDYAVSADEITFRVVTGADDAQEVVQTTAAKIAPYVLVSTSLTDMWEPVEVQNVHVDDDGLVRVIKPTDRAAYFRIVLPKDK